MYNFSRELYSICVFGSTYTCEQAFSRMNQNKSKYHSRIIDAHLHDVTRIDI
jgi:hypothetical protein